MKNHEQENDALQAYMKRITKAFDRFGVHPSLVWFRFSLDDNGSLQDFFFDLVTKEDFLNQHPEPQNEFPGVSITSGKEEEVDRFLADQAKRMTALKEFWHRDIK